MDDTSIDRILENLLHLLPVLHKKLIKKDLGDDQCNLTRLHFAIMGILHHGSMNVTELAKMLAIPKSQMTLLIDQLVKLDIVERFPDTEDRRVINLALTNHGKALLDDMKQKIKKNIKETLSGLTPEELAEMSRALEALRTIISKL